MYDPCSICIFFLLSIMGYFSWLDLSFRNLQNIELIPSLILGICCGTHNVLNYDPHSLPIAVSFYLLGSVFSFFLYFGGFFGAADLKVFLILILTMNPLTQYGITSNIDGVQMFYYYCLFLLVFFLLRLIRNSLFHWWFVTWKINSLKVTEILFLFMFCRLQKINHSRPFEVLLLNLNIKKLPIQQPLKLELGLIAWTTRPVPMIPFFTASLILTIFT